jgi:hypothetical protein
LAQLALAAQRRLRHVDDVTDKKPKTEPVATPKAKAPRHKAFGSHRAVRAHLRCGHRTIVSGGRWTRLAMSSIRSPPPVKGEFPMALPTIVVIVVIVVIVLLVLGRGRL